MEHISYIRNFHPVGQGAFFTEQFFRGSTTIFNVVYDCGEFHTPKHVEVESKKTFIYDESNPLHIDVLFISHLDDDHVNGIPLLIQKGCIDKGTTVILPFSYPLLLYYILPDTNLNTITQQTIRRLFETEAKILGVRYSEGFVSENQRFPIDKYFEERENYSQLPPKIELHYQSIWHYIPFMNVDDEGIWHNFESKIKQEGIKACDLMDAKYIMRHHKKLKEIYNSVTKNWNGVTPINICSLQLLSFKDMKVSALCVTSCNESFLLSSCLPLYLSSKRWFSCLYTGDTIMNNAFFNSLSNIKKFLGDSIELLQLPHHGRQSCFNEMIVQRGEYDTAFVNYNSLHEKNAYVGRIHMLMMLHCRPLLRITESNGYVMVLKLQKSYS